MAKVKANATCGWCYKPMLAPPNYDRRINTVFCCAEHTIAELLFRTVYADDVVAAVGFRRISLEKDNG